MGRVPFKNELGEDDFKEDKIKNMFAGIIPIKIIGNISQGQVNTKYAETTHRVKVRKLSIKNPTIDMFFIYDGLRYDFLYFQPDFKNKEFLEINVQVKYE